MSPGVSVICRPASATKLGMVAKRLRNSAVGFLASDGRYGVLGYALLHKADTHPQCFECPRSCSCVQCGGIGP